MVSKISKSPLAFQIPKEDTKYKKEMMAIKENHSIISKTHLLIFKEDLLVLVDWKVDKL